MKCVPKLENPNLYRENIFWQLSNGAAAFCFQFYSHDLIGQFQDAELGELLLLYFILFAGCSVYSVLQVNLVVLLSGLIFAYKFDLFYAMFMNYDLLVPHSCINMFILCIVLKWITFVMCDHMGGFNQTIYRSKIKVKLLDIQFNLCCLPAYVTNSMQLAKLIISFNQSYFLSDCLKIFATFQRTLRNLSVLQVISFLLEVSSPKGLTTDIWKVASATVHDTI